MANIVNIPSDDFFQLQRKITSKCENEFSPPTMCKVSASDLEFNILDKAGFFPDLFGKPTLPFGFPISRPDKVVLKADEVDLMAERTIHKCNQFISGIEPETPDDIKEMAKRNYNQCQRGVELVLSELSPFLKRKKF